MKELLPVNENVLIAPQPVEQKTAGGIIIPDTAAAEKPVIGTVKGLGTIEKCGIAIGDKVIYKKYSGTEIEFEKKNYIILPYADILAKIVETETI